MTFLNAASTKDLEPGSMKSVELDGKEIFLANVGGKYYAMGNRYPYECLLSDGDLRGENVACSCHGSTFDLKTGNVLKGPARKPEPVYKVKVEGNDVLIGI